MSREVLELRLEHVGYVYGETNAEQVLMTAATQGVAMDDRPRLFAALEFFDRALLSCGGGLMADSSSAINEKAAGVVFAFAAALTLLRFGVRIVGLEAEVEQPVVIRPEQDEEFAP